MRVSNENLSERRKVLFEILMRQNHKMAIHGSSNSAVSHPTVTPKCVHSTSHKEIELMLKNSDTFHFL